MQDFLFEVSDLKQWTYCPRVVYYRHCLPTIRPTTALMDQGLLSHRDEAEREARRSLRTYGLDAGERSFDLRLVSPALGLTGRVDLAIALPATSGAPKASAPGEAIVVEYKDSERLKQAHFKLQLAAYALMVEEAWGVPVRRGFLYSIPNRAVEPVPITPLLRRKVVDTVAAVRAAVDGESLPPPPNSRFPCVSCEFRRFCNDVV